jgi:UDPglucose 6-dehydrogenase
MKVGVVGLGHVGLVSAACFAHIGHEVSGVDADAERVEGLRRGRMPFFEPGLADLVERELDSGRLKVSSSLGSAVRGSTVLFICVGTPSKADGEADLIEIELLATGIARHADGYRLLVEKSTVPVTTGERVVRTVEREGGRWAIEVAANPEFLRQGSAIEDTLRPSRIVIGAPSTRATALLREVYGPIVERSGCPVIETDVATAELIKHASNAFLATKISFVNAVAEVCERAGADIEAVAHGMGLDPRIGPAFLQAGIGYGGSCLPKDLSAFSKLASGLGCELPLLEEVRAINERGPVRLLDKLRQELWHLAGKTIAVLGLAFKPGTDDMREAPAMRVVKALLEEGAGVTAYDPVAMPAAKELLPGVHFAATALDAAAGADAAVFLTDWDEFRALDLAALKRILRLPIVVDGRNIFAPDDMLRAGLIYQSMGRPPVHP